MIYTLPTSQPAGAAGKKPCAKCAKKQNGPLVLNGQTSGPIMPMGNNLFQQPTVRRTTTTTPQGKNLFTQRSMPAATSRAFGLSHRRGLHGLGQEDSINFPDTLPLTLGTTNSLDVLPLDTSNLSTIENVVPDYSNAPDISNLTTTINPFLTPAISTGELTTGDVSSIYSPSSVADYAAQTGMSTAQALQAITAIGQSAANLAAATKTGGTYPAGYPTGTQPSWLSQQSLITGVPNWAILAGGGALFMVLAVAAGKKRR